MFLTPIMLFIPWIDPSSTHPVHQIHPCCKLFDLMMWLVAFFAHLSPTFFSNSVDNMVSINSFYLVSSFWWRWWWLTGSGLDKDPNYSPNDLIAFLAYTCKYSFVFSTYFFLCIFFLHLFRIHSSFSWSSLSLSFSFSLSLSLSFSLFSFSHWQHEFHCFGCCHTLRAVFFWEPHYQGRCRTWVIICKHLYLELLRRRL